MTEKISVLHILNQLGLGGTEKAMEVFVRSIDKEQINVGVCGYENGGIRGEKLREDGYSVYVTNSSKESLAEAIRERDVDVLHIHGMYNTTSAVVDVALDTNVSAIVKTTPFGRVTAGCKSEIDLHFFPSKMTLLRKLKLDRKELFSGDWNQNFRLQYNPLSTDDVSNQHTEDLRKALGIKSDTNIIGKIGQSSSAKWSQVSVDAFERICTLEPKTKILLITPPEKIRNAISRRGLSSNVEYLDSLPLYEVGKFYNTIDVLAHASGIGESFGYVIAEALAYGTPVVVDSNPMRDNAHIELVNNGKNGFVVGSSKAYADATLELLRSDKRQREFGNAAREQATTRFDPKPIVEELETIYRTLYESNGDATSIETQLDPQYEMMSEFETEYRRRLHDLYATESIRQRLERGTWRLCSEYLPIGRDVTYHGLQGLFKDI